MRRLTTVRRPTDDAERKAISHAVNVSFPLSDMTIERQAGSDASFTRLAGLDYTEHQSTNDIR